MPKKFYDKSQGPTALWLLDQIEEYLTINDMDNDGNTFGWLVARDRTLVQRLREGGDVNTTRMDDILSFMQRPVEYRTSAKHGDRVMKILKPLTIQPKELP